MWAKDKLVFLCLVAVAVGVAQATPDELAAKYKCGSNCGEQLMGPKAGAAPSAAYEDSMPHRFAPSQFAASTRQAMESAMNAMVPVPEPPVPLHDRVYAMPDATQASGLHILPMSLSLPVPSSAETVAADKPALRRPCNLDRVLELLREVKAEYLAEGEHDAHSRGSNAAEISDAKLYYSQAQKAVADMLSARDANDTLTNTLAAIDIKGGLLENAMNEKAVLVGEEGSLKSPLVRAIGRTNINLQQAIEAKKGAVGDIAQHPAFSKDEVQQVLNTYDQLIVSFKKQLEALHKEASDVLTPVQLKINQTEHTIERINTEILELQAQRDSLVPLAETFSPIALDAFRAIEADSVAHLTAENTGASLETKSFDQRMQDRENILHVIDQLIMLVSDIQEPQDVNDAVVSSPDRVPESLAGSIPRPVLH